MNKGKQIEVGSLPDCPGVVKQGSVPVASEVLQNARFRRKRAALSVHRHKHTAGVRAGMAHKVTLQHPVAALQLEPGCWQACK